MYEERVVSGMRPTGAMHLGHYHGALKNWMKLQSEYPCLYFVADWHALTTHYETPEVIEESVWDMVIDWLAAGIDPAQATLFIQSRIPERAELQGPAGKAHRPRPFHLRVSRLPASAGGRRAHIPRKIRSGRRRPGPARRDDARGRAALQPRLRP